MNSDSDTGGSDRLEVIDLFKGRGGFSSAFQEPDRWGVITVDNNPKFEPDVCTDVMTMDPTGLDPDVVLASPPCTDFSVACITDKWDRDEHRRPRHLPKWGEIAHSMAIVFRTLWLIHEMDPDYWFLENPQGMLNVWLGESVARVDQCAYGDEFQKPTHLWGKHPPMEYRTCIGRKCHHQTWGEWGTYRDEDSEERAEIPYSLSACIRDACEKAFDDPPPEQSTLISGGGAWNSGSLDTDT